MTNPVYLGSGQVFSKKGLVTGNNINGDTISGNKIKDGQWALTNQKNGSQFNVNVTGEGSSRHLEATRTDKNGNVTTNDLTLLLGQNGNFGVYDFNQSGWQAKA